jgi:hypothetical protein
MFSFTALMSAFLSSSDFTAECCIHHLWFNDSKYLNKLIYMLFQDTKWYAISKQHTFQRNTTFGFDIEWFPFLSWNNMYINLFKYFESLNHK